MPFSPVCPQDSVFTYFSPCHAGCQTRTELNDVVIYTNCSCGIDTELVLRESGIATEGACGMLDCQKHWIIFQVLTVVMAALLASGLIGKFVISIRAVLPQDKALALSIELTLIGLVVYLPGMAAYQAIAGKYIYDYISFETLLIFVICFSKCLSVMVIRSTKMFHARDALLWYKSEYFISCTYCNWHNFRHISILFRKRSSPIR